jgi:hypothetical protein
MSLNPEGVKLNLVLLCIHMTWNGAGKHTNQEIQKHRKSTFSTFIHHRRTA